MHEWQYCQGETGYYHINIQEMLAVQFELRSFAGKYKSLTFWLNIDNTTFVSILAK